MQRRIPRDWDIIITEMENLQQVRIVMSLSRRSITNARTDRRVDITDTVRPDRLHICLCHIGGRCIKSQIKINKEIKRKGDGHGKRRHMSLSYSLMFYLYIFNTVTSVSFLIPTLPTSTQKLELPVIDSIACHSYESRRSCFNSSQVFHGT